MSTRFTEHSKAALAKLNDAELRVVVLLGVTPDAMNLSPIFAAWMSTAAVWEKTRRLGGHDEHLDGDTFPALDFGHLNGAELAGALALAFCVYEQSPSPLIAQFLAFANKGVVAEASKRLTSTWSN